MDIETIKQLFATGDMDEAREALEDFLESAISEREQGEALIALGSMYMEIENTINREYLGILQQAMDELSSLTTNHVQVTDAINLVKTRKEIEAEK